MKKNVVLSLAAWTLIYTSIPVTVHADYLDSIKTYGEKAKFWKDKPKEYNFNDIYPKKFYKKSYFAATAITAAIVGGVTVSYFTGGVGAPAAAAGVSSFASMIAGGGAGSYLAGLATVGSWFGGGMVLGGAILNGIVIGSAVGGAASMANMTLQEKIEASSLATAMSMDGIVYFKNPDTGKNEYRIRLEIPKNIGSKEVQQIVNNIYEVNGDLVDALQDGDEIKQKALSESVKLYTDSAVKLLEKKLSDKTLSPEDSVVLSVIAWRNGNFDIFDKSMIEAAKTNVKNKSFIDYLLALKYLRANDIENTLVYLDKSNKADHVTLEPILLKINILSNLDFTKHELEIDNLAKLAKENFNSDKYATSLNLLSLYYRVGSIYFVNKKYAQAHEYFEKARAQLGFLQKNFFGEELKHTVELAMANSLYANGKDIQADKMYYSIINDIDEKEGLEELKKIKNSYLGTRHETK